MPQRLAKPCRDPFCKVLHRNRSGYCDSHTKTELGWAKHQQRKGNTTERGYGWAWQKLRAQTLQRDHYLCQQCQREGRITEGTEVDHIIPKSWGGEDAWYNLQTLCKTCHQHKTGQESRSQPSSTGGGC